MSTDAIASTCTCGCGVTTEVTEAAEPCGCGCRCCNPPQSRDEEVTRLRQLRDDIDERLSELEG